MLCVGNDNDVLSVVKGETGVLKGMKAGSTLIDHNCFRKISLAKICQELAAPLPMVAITFFNQ